MKNILFKWATILTILPVSLMLYALKPVSEVVPDADNAGLKLPAGFGALKVAETGAKARHLVVTPQGDIYVKLAKPNKEGNGILVLHEAPNGKAELK